MARSRIGENQVKDADFLSSEEHDNEINHYFSSLVDAPTYSGIPAGRVLTSTGSGVEWSTVSGA